MWKFICIAIIFVSLYTGLTIADSSASAFSTASAGGNSASASANAFATAGIYPCRRNERLVKCPETLCVPLSCDQVGFPIVCPIVGPGGPCNKPAECICIDGYLKNNNGFCVPKQQCPSCGKDANAIPGCGFDCERRRCDTNIVPVSDPCPCDRNGCVCKEGYLYDDVQRKCVIPQQCNKPKENEVFSPCGDFGCEKRNCTQIDQPDICIDPVECFGGYVCVEGYLRARNGTCIPRDQCYADNTTPECSEDVLDLLQYGNALFTAKFLYEAYENSPQESLIMSPLSVFVPMGELALYAEGATYEQLMKVLNLRTKDDIRCVFPILTNNLKSDKDVILTLAARIFSTDVYPLSQNFFDDTKNIFGAEAESLDFNNPQNAADRINEWVADNTNNRIQNIASPQMFDEYTRLVLANAIFFLGNWVDQFNPNDTMNRPFYMANNESEEIPTMYQNSNFKYGESENLNCKILEMPYKGGAFSFAVFLPNTVDGLYNLIEKLLDPEAFYTAYNATSYEKVNVYLPKIKIESEFNLSDIMQKIGITDIFDASKSNLNGILQKYEPLSVSTALQKAFALVDETGTEAAAANILVGSATGSIGNIRPVYTFKADRPFLYYILNGLDIIFCGTFVK